MTKHILFFALSIACFMGVSQAQVQVAPFTNSKVQFLNGSAPCAGCLLSTFSAGTSTPLATYSESTGTTLNSNPIVLDSNGFATIYLTTASYKFVLKTAASVTIWTQDGVTWNNLATTLTSLTTTGNAIVKPSVAATGSANQSSPTWCINGFYFNVTSLTDQWCFQTVLGTGTSPTSTFNLTHSGSGGTAQINFSPALTFSALTATGNLTVGGNAAITGTLGVTGVSTLGTLNAGATSVTSMVNTGDESLSSGKVIKWNNATSLSQTNAGEISVGTGAQGSNIGTVKAASFISNQTGTLTSAGFQATSSTLPFFGWNITSGLPDSHWWDCGVQSAVVFRCAAVSDSNTANNWVTVNRSAGAGLGAITFGAGTFVQTLPQATGTLLATGNGATPVQTKRVTTGSVGATSRLDVTVTWTTTFADTNYTASCFVLDTTAAGVGLRVERIRTQNAGSMIVQAANDAAGALTGTLHCIAIHD